MGFDMTEDILRATSESRLVARYIPCSPHYSSDAPTMASSLAVFEASPEFHSHVAAQGSSIDCLFQGYTSPSNAQAIVNTLQKLGTTKTHIAAIDKINLPEVYDLLGVEQPDIEFVHADACDLGDRFGDRKFNFVLQDFILNCMAPAGVPSLLREAKRHLKPAGVCLISFSADAHAPTDKTKTLTSVLAVWPQVQLSDGLHEMASNDIEFREMEQHLLGSSILDEQTGHLTHVTDPSGKLEFFISKTDVIDMFEDAGLEISIVGVESAIDYNGLKCSRFRVLAVHAEPGSGT
jgi:SAM-dependent methyltransferase